MAKYVYIDGNELLDILRNAMRSGMSASAMHTAVTTNETFEDCCGDLGVGAVEFRHIFGGERLPVEDTIFIREDQPEWRLWDAYRSAPDNRQGRAPEPAFRQVLPEQLPPADEPPPRKRA